ncbi:MAG: dTDP-4-dehydrorhamnose 3,5-epimerase [Betaproteobacteria bacterium]|nr:dTDP-4-dehydrorhamnose 3,5-epimerase [Betaproteobacteria bacterium]
MKTIVTAIPDVLVLEPRVFEDERGFFLERYNKRDFAAVTGADVEFVQDNHSRSRKGVLRGLHYQIKQPQGKLVSVLVGEIFDVAVDLRRDSRTFGQWAGFALSASTRQMAWIPAGFAHGFIVLSDAAEVLYKATDYYAPEHERTLLWNDPQVGVAWPLADVLAPTLAEKDRRGTPFLLAESFGRG